MEFAVELSPLPAERLKTFINTSHAFPWRESERAETLIRNLCQSMDHECELLGIAIREGVPDAIRRTFERNPGRRAEKCIAFVVDHYAERMQGRLAHAESEWSVRTIAAALGAIPLQSVSHSTGALPPIGMSAESAPAAQPPEAPLGYSYQSQQAAEPAQDSLSEPMAAHHAGEDSEAFNPIGASPLLTPDPPQPAGMIDPQQFHMAQAPAPPPLPAPLDNLQAGYAPPMAPVAAPPAPPWISGAPAASPPWSPEAAAPAGAPGAWPPAAPPPPGAPAGYDQRMVQQSYWPESIIPEEVEEGRWCWSGFLGGIWWMWAHGMRVGLPIWGVLFIATRLLPSPWGLVVRILFYAGLNVYLGLMGNRLAWQNRTFNSKQEYRAVQKAWVIFGSIWTGIQVIFIGFLIMAAIAVYSMIRSAPSYSTGGGAYSTGYNSGGTSGTGAGYSSGYDSGSTSGAASGYSPSTGGSYGTGASGGSARSGGGGGDFYN